jgi:hypothetical protein
VKLKGIEGTPEEIHDLFKNNGLDMSKFISAPLLARWVITPAVFATIVLLIILVGPVLYPNFSTKCLAGAIVLSLVCSLWLTTAIHVRFDSVTVTAVVGIGAILITLVAAGIMAPAEIVPLLKQFKS